MSDFQDRRKTLSQNFLPDGRLISRLVAGAALTHADTVLDLGAGKGFITTELLKVAGNVVAVELDDKLVLHLRRHFADEPRLRIHHGDILDFPLPKGAYHVFANIPFSLGGAIVRKLLDCPNPPQSTHLIMDARLATRLSGQPRANLFSLAHEPWFAMDIVHRFRRADFAPPPSIDTVLWRVVRRDEPLVPWAERRVFEDFLEVGFGQGESIRANLARHYGRDRTRAVLAGLSINGTTKPGYVPLADWLRLYRHFLKRA